MSSEESYRGKVFVVEDPDCRLRRPGDLLSYEMDGKGPRRIPPATRLHISEVKVVPMGTRRNLIFGAASALDGSAIGWTSTRNLQGRFVNETLGSLPPPANPNRFGPNAAWSKGSYIGQVTLVQIVDATLDIEHIALDTLGPYMALVEAARSDGVAIMINSAFRSYPEQKMLYEGYKKGLAGFNKAAPPGASNHQNGVAFDIPVAGGAGNPAYDWLAGNATRFGFVRTVSGEPWHWEYAPAKAEAARQARRHKIPGVNP